MSITFSKTQLAQNTPFDNATNGFVSTDVQAAIEEALAQAVANDRFVIFCSYGGNASAGRYLEIFPANDMLDAPLNIVNAANLLSVVIGANATSTGGIAWYNLDVSSTVPVYTLNFGGLADQNASGTVLSPLAFFPAGASIACRVVTASVNKPHVYFFLSSSI